MAVVRETEYDRTMEDVKDFHESKIGVKGLVDSGISRLKPSASPNLGIPIVDLSGLNSDRRSQIVDEVKEACRNWGFFQVINHGIPVQVMEETINAIRSFHEQSLMEINNNTAKDQIKVSIHRNADLFGSNWRDTLIPLEPLEKIPMVCRKELMEWDEQTKRLGENLMEALCEGLGVVAGRLKELSCLDKRTIVCHYYPYCPQPDLTTMGLNAHSDKSLLTLVLKSESDECGLQVKHGGDWVEVSPIHGAIIVNVGELLQIISNDEYKSVEHQVLANRSWDPKITIAVFFTPRKNGDTDYYGPLPELLSSVKPALYRDFIEPEILKQALRGPEVKSLMNLFKLGDVTTEGP